MWRNTESIKRGSLLTVCSQVMDIALLTLRASQTLNTPIWRANPGQVLFRCKCTIRQVMCRSSNYAGMGNLHLPN